MATHHNRKNSSSRLSETMASLFRIWILLFTSGVVAGQFQLEPVDVSVLLGSQAIFKATVEGTWEIMTWNVKGLLVLTVSKTDNITSSSDKYTASYCSSGDTNCVQFTIVGTTRDMSGPVVCTVQGDFGSKTSQLSVQESGTVDILGGNVTAVQGVEVNFQCQTSGWFPAPTVSWTMNGAAVNSSWYNLSSTAHGATFNSTSFLKFQAEKNATVECLASVPALASPSSDSIFMQVVLRPPDWTVLIAVVVSIGSFALLVLLVLALIWCYKRKKEKEPNYQDEMSRRVRTQSQLSEADRPAQRQGRVNPVFMVDGQTHNTPDPHYDNRVTETHTSEMPDMVNANRAGNGYSNTYQTPDEFASAKAHRHATMV